MPCMSCMYVGDGLEKGGARGGPRLEICGKRAGDEVKWIAGKAEWFDTLPFLFFSTTERTDGDITMAATLSVCMCVCCGGQRMAFISSHFVYILHMWFHTKLLLAPMFIVCVCVCVCFFFSRAERGFESSWVG